MDASKLSPAPWHVKGPWSNGLFDVVADAPDYGRSPAINLDAVDAEFIALARNAFDVMMRRGWWAARLKDGKWRVSTFCAIHGESAFRKFLVHQMCDDPFTALVEADKWYREKNES
jgi:hypothetical protein